MSRHVLCVLCYVRHAAISCQGPIVFMGPGSGSWGIRDARSRLDYL